jgi:hypothetical protein
MKLQAIMTEAAYILIGAFSGALAAGLIVCAYRVLAHV